MVDMVNALKELTACIGRPIVNAGTVAALRAALGPWLELEVANEMDALRYVRWYGFVSGSVRKARAHGLRDVDVYVRRCAGDGVRSVVIDSVMKLLQGLAASGGGGMCLRWTAMWVRVSARD